MKDNENLTVSATSGSTKTYSLDEAFQFATALLQKGRVQEAVSIYQSVLNVREDHHQALHYLGLAKYQLGEKKEAIELIDKALVSMPDYIDAHNNLGNILRIEREFTKAKEHYRAALSLDNQHHQALNNLGGIYKLEKDYEQALDCYQKALAVDNTNPDYHLNAGTIQQSLNDWEGALQSFEKTVALNPEGALGHERLGQTLDAMGEYDKAIASFERALQLDSSQARSHTSQGDALASKGLLEDAVLAYRKAIKCDSKFIQAYSNLAVVLGNLSRLDECREIVEQWVAFDGDNPMAQHSLASLGMTSTPDRASNDYVEKLFDSASGKFDKTLGGLEYKAPQLLTQALKAIGAISEENKKRILDAGCGTGLCGPLLEPYKNYLIGVDLSDGMLDQARKMDCYDELVHTELTGFMQKAEDNYDLIISADTLIYFGELQAAIDAASKLQSPGAWLAFTVEKHPDGSNTADYQINTNGRYSHSTDYVKSVCEKGGYRVEKFDPITPRMEGGKPVPGALILAVREDATKPN